MQSFLKRLNVPHVFILLSAIILFCSALTYIIPAGQFERSSRTVGKMQQTVVLADSYKELPKHYSLKGLILGEKVEGKASPTSLLGLFTSIPKGLNQSAALIFFIFTIGAVFNLIRQTGTIHVLIYGLMRKFKNRPNLLIFGIFLVISLLSTFLGMGTEFMPLIPLFMIISKACGYDRIFGLALLAIPFSLGWTVALTNPFTVQIAQKIAEVPIGSGMGLRLILFVIILGLGFIYLMRYGKRVQKNRALSHMPEDPFHLPDDENVEELKLE